MKPVNLKALLLATLCLMLAQASHAAPAPKKLAIVKLAFSQSEDGEVVKVRWPEFYTGEGSPVPANAGT